MTNALRSSSGSPSLGQRHGAARPDRGDVGERRRLLRGGRADRGRTAARAGSRHRVRSSQMNASRSASRYGSGSISSAWTMLKMAVLAPMPSARVATMTAVTPRVCPERRARHSARRAATTRGRRRCGRREPLRAPGSARAGPPSASSAARSAASRLMPSVDEAIGERLDRRAQLVVELALERCLAERACSRRSSVARSAARSRVIIREHLPDGERDALPLLLLGRQPPLPGRRNRVVLRAASLGRRRPLAGDEAVLLEPVEHREQRARPDLKRPAA